MILVTLKPQDIVVAFKLVLNGRDVAYAQLGSELGMSASEVHGAVRRLAEGGLLITGKRQVLCKPFYDLLIYAVSHVFPAREGEITRGMPTAWAAPVLSSRFQSDMEGKPVWPDPEGTIRGNSVVPLYPSVPKAAKTDPHLYEMLALVDALRIGRARERKIAGEELKKRLLKNG